MLECQDRSFLVPRGLSARRAPAFWLSTLHSRLSALDCPQRLRRRHKEIALRIIFAKIFSPVQKTVDALRRFLLNHLLSLLVSLLKRRDGRRRANARSAWLVTPLRSQVHSFLP
jgi:hypothetical protein